MDEPLYVGKPYSYPTWLRIPLIAGALIPAIGFLSLTFSAAIEGSVLGGMAFVLFLMAYVFLGILISPRRFDIYPNRLEIVLPWLRVPLRFNSLVDIESVSWRQTIGQPAIVIGDFRSPLLLVRTRLPIRRKTWLPVGHESRVFLTVRNHDVFTVALEDARAKYVASRGSMA